MKSFLLWIVILLVYAGAAAQNPTWNIRLSEGNQLRGTPISVTSDSLLLRSEGGVQQALPLSGITQVSYREGNSHAGQGLAIGLLSGAAAGYVTGLIADGSKSESSSPYGTDEGSGNLKAVLPVIGGVIGGVVGFGIGAGSGKESLDLSSLSSAEKAAALKSLIDHPNAVALKGGTGAGSQQYDVLTLKNGMVMRGSVVEWIPDSTAKIITPDGKTYVFKSTEIERFVRGSVMIAGGGTEDKPSRVSEAGPTDVGNADFVPRFRFGLNIGASFPVGDFANTTSSSGGAAKPGVMFGGDLEYRFDRIASLIAGVSVAINTLDQEVTGTDVDVDPWTTVWPMVGIRLYPQTNSPVEPYFQGQLGILLGTSYGMHATYGDASFSLPSSSASAVAFSIGTGMIIVHRVNIGVRYLYGSPEYTMTATASEGGMTAVGTGKFQQPTGMVQLSVGVVF